MQYEYKLQTPTNALYDITRQLEEAIEKSGVENGLAIVYCPHTTAAITINEHYDPTVAKDLLFALDHAFPDQAAFQHAEGNSTAHMKASVIGASETVLLQNGRPLLGRWQGVFFCEFDAPRTRSFYIRIQPQSK
mgnify:CR=1 FL=1